jgi:ribonuclease VapC
MSMGFNIKNDEAHRLAKKLAGLTGDREEDRGASQRALSIRRPCGSPVRRARIAPMIIDASVLLAILRDEPEAAACAEAIQRADGRRPSVSSKPRRSSMAARDPVASRGFDDLLREARISIDPVTEARARMARDALAKITDEPLLFKGRDFALPM